MNYKMFILYFFAGGFIMSGIMYLGSTGKEYWAAFLAMLPIWTVFPLFALYYHNGLEASLNFVHGLILLTVPWLLYTSSIVWFVPYYGIQLTSIIAFLIFIISALGVNWLRRL